jgi:hypothetical protein
VTRLPWTTPPLLLTLTVRPPGNTLSDVHICVVGGLSTDAIAWSARDPRFCQPVAVTVETRDIRTIQWYWSTFLVATLTPFPDLHHLKARPVCFRPERTAPVYDHIFVEERQVQEYIDESPGNQFIVYGLDQTPHTLMRAQLATAKVYLPCRQKESADQRGVDVLHKAVATIAIPEGTFFVPCLQLEALLLVPGTCRVQLIATGIVWDCSVVYLYSAEDRADAQSFVGGSANNGGPGSSKEVHFLCRLP